MEGTALRMVGDVVPCKVDIGTYGGVLQRVYDTDDSDMAPLAIQRSGAWVRWM